MQTNRKLVLPLVAALTLSLPLSATAESISFTGTDSAMLPIRPRRCSYLRLRIEGQGDARLYAITKTLQQGSETP